MYTQHTTIFRFRRQGCSLCINRKKWWCFDIMYKQTKNPIKNHFIITDENINRSNKTYHYYYDTFSAENQWYGAAEQKKLVWDMGFGRCFWKNYWIWIFTCNFIRFKLQSKLLTTAWQLHIIPSR